MAKQDKKNVAQDDPSIVKYVVITEDLKGAVLQLLNLLPHYQVRQVMDIISGLPVHSTKKVNAEKQDTAQEASDRPATVPQG